MDNREKNIATLIEGFNISLDYLRKKTPKITEQNFEKIKQLMTEYMAEWIDKSEGECDTNVDELIQKEFGILWRLEVMHMIHQHRKSAHG